MSEPIHLLNEAQTLLLCMRADTAKAEKARAEIIEIIKAWRRGELLPEHEAPLLMRIYGSAYWSKGPRR
jgi:hypothetical protein